MNKGIIEDALKWLRARGKKEGFDLGALTGQDARALRTFIAAVDLYAASDHEGRIHAIRAM
ncbi:MAG: hypothetical protein ACREJC_10005, partial [Tepidisphaeraceae bacterium]